MANSSIAKLPPTLSSPPPPVPDVIISFPKPHVLLVTLNRPKQLNAIPRPQHIALDQLWGWYDAESSLRCAVITGTGRAFCAGQDLKEWNQINTGAPGQPSPGTSSPSGGFGGLSNRGGKKPVIAAVNGICFGGGMEMAINCDMVIAAEKATFSLPEVTIGVTAVAGALPRLMRSVGRQRASEMALSGKNYSAAEMHAWGLVNEVVKDGGDVVAAALAWAVRIAGNSPDAVIVSREGLKLGWEGLGPQQATDLMARGFSKQMEKGENMVEGVKSFVERRKPVWRDSKL
ncbi:enoyl-hydratase [Xylaria sp. CBS 124048]|nr:enoyl-hydratase [Xylaria sp. CBS 124048]